MSVNALTYQGLYVSVVTPPEATGHILFVHGGPGSNSAPFEQAVQELEAYRNLPYGWIVYDQRGCGRSERPSHPVTHAQNLRDLEDLVDACRTFPGVTALKTVFGHSYGSWLVYDLFIRHPDWVIKLVMVGRSKDRNLSRNRSLLMDLLILKRLHPESYRRAVEMLQNHQGPLWHIARTIRSFVPDPSLRDLFYWGNFETMDWYKDLKKRIDLPDQEETFKSVRASMYGDDADLSDIDPAKLTQSVLWINGFHDFLMGGESYEWGKASSVTTFMNSGHFAHLEEPDRFAEELMRFLEEEES